MVSQDRNGTPATHYPDTHLDGVFLGINGEGLGEYHTDEHVFLAEYTDDGLQVPPTEYGIAHEFYLEEMTLADYIQATTDEHGPWRFLSDIARQVLSNAGIDPADHEQTGNPTARGT
jgi:hypothetical protein